MITSYCRRPGPEEFIYYDGLTFRIEWYYAADGRMPGRECYLALDEIDQERLDKIVKYLADSPFGVQLPKSLYRVEDAANKIYAFKPRAERFFNFIAAGRRIVITNAYRKHSQKMGKTDLDKLKTAAVHREDYLRRVGNGTYYETRA